MKPESAPRLGFGNGLNRPIASFRPFSEFRRISTWWWWCGGGFSRRYGRLRVAMRTFFAPSGYSLTGFVQSGPIMWQFPRIGKKLVRRVQIG